MSKKSEEHFKNHPNDMPHSEREKRILSKYNKLNKKLTVRSVMDTITIRLLRSQIESDSQIKDMFVAMFPEEYKLALSSCIKKHGATKNKKIIKKEIIESMNLKKNILKERNPAHYCMSPDCGKYLGHRGFCSEECHNKHYEGYDDTTF